MKRHKKGEMPEITREIYKGVKRMDRQQFQKFCAGLYEYGYEDGRDSVPGIDVDKVIEVIGAVKGIGKTRLVSIAEALDKELCKKKESAFLRAIAENNMKKQENTL